MREILALTDPVDHDALAAALEAGLTPELTVGDIERALNLIDVRKARAASPSRRSGTTLAAYDPE